MNQFPPEIYTTLDEYFIPGGYLYENYGMHKRTSQQMMINTVCNAIAQCKGALIEAPTGTGKTMGYLLPSCEYAKYQKANNKEIRVVLSTTSKVLQDQLDGKDFPLLSKLYPELKFFVWKGATNYLCLNRLYDVLRRTKSPQLQVEAANLWKHSSVLDSLPHGFRNELPIEVSDELWERICGDTPCCTAQGHYTCHKRNAYTKAKESNILCVNHTLLISTATYADFIHPAKPPPEDTILIFDEAHELLTNLRFSLNKNFNITALKSLIDNINASDIKTQYKRQLHAVEDALKDALSTTDSLRVSPTTTDLNSALLNLCGLMLGLGDKYKSTFEYDSKRDINTEEAKQELQVTYESLYKNASMIYNHLTMFPTTEILTATKEPKQIRISLLPFTYTKELNHLYSYANTPPILTSATLINSAKRLLLEKYALKPEEVIVQEVPNSFDYQSTIKGLCFPAITNSNNSDEIAPYIQELLSISAGNALVLFTNFKTMDEVAEKVKPWCIAQGYTFLSQSTSSLPAMVAHMKANKNTILFGNLSLWTGVDVKGSNLSHLIITKLPFPMLDAYTDAYSGYLKSQGYDPFYDWQLVEMITRFRQGIGRLKRDEADKGIISVLDPRFINGRYANLIYTKLPQFEWKSISNMKDLPEPTETQEWLGVTPPPIELVKSYEDNDDPF